MFAVVEATPVVLFFETLVAYVCTIIVGYTWVHVANEGVMQPQNAHRPLVPLGQSPERRLT